MPTECGLYKGQFRASTAISQQFQYLLLATGTKIRAPRRLHHPPNERTAPQAGLSGAIIHLESFLVELGLISISPVVKKAVATSAAGKIQRQCATAIDGFLQDFADGFP